MSLLRVQCAGTNLGIKTWISCNELSHFCFSDKWSEFVKQFIIINIITKMYVSIDFFEIVFKHSNECEKQEA